MIARRIAVRGIIFKDGKLLCQQLKPGKDGKSRDFWCTPGGGLDPNEGLTDGLRREMTEETGVMPDIGNLLFIQQLIDGSEEHLEFFFHIKNADDYTAVDLAKTTHGELEIENMNFIDPAKENVLPAFLQTIDINDAIENQKPVEIISYL
ncbi:MAG TPA: NUDIX domain-containing protein [Candidatus Saccharimonadales bacterium]|nr:NUDIX domain-containing protein [Candidatus Saccharimonadales bacterium]